MKKICLIALFTLTCATSALAQSPPPPSTQPTQLETRGTPNSEQQRLDWQRERADEYYRRLRDYVASIAPMA